MNEYLKGEIRRAPDSIGTVINFVLIYIYIYCKLVLLNVSTEIHVARNFPIFCITKRKLRVSRIRAATTSDEQYIPRRLMKNGAHQGEKKLASLYETRAIFTCAPYTRENSWDVQIEPIYNYDHFEYLWNNGEKRLQNLRIHSSSQKKRKKIIIRSFLF